MFVWREGNGRVQHHLDNLLFIHVAASEALSHLSYSAKLNIEVMGVHLQGQGGGKRPCARGLSQELHQRDYGAGEGGQDTT